MSKFVVIFVLVFSVCFSCSSFSFVNKIEHTVGLSLEQLRTLSGVAGFSMAAIKDSEVVYSVNSGYWDKALSRPVNSNTRFRLASVSKLVAASLFADLIQQQLIKKSDSLKTLLPQLPEKYHKITIEQLMRHTSGIPHYQAVDACCWETHYISATESLAVLKNRDLLFEPGSQYHYSSFGYTILGAVFEKVTGTTLVDGIEGFINRVSGRVTPIVEDITKRDPHRSNLFTLTRGKPASTPFDDKTYTALGGGLSSTATDLALLADRIVNGNYFSDEIKSLMFQPNYHDVSPKNKMYNVGFGWRVGKDFDGHTVYHHAGVTLGARSFLIVYPEQNLTLAFLSNTSWVSQMETNGFALAKLIRANTYLKSGVEPFEKQQLKGTFNGKEMNGEISCTGSKCVFEDNSGLLSNWLNKYNHVNSRKSAQNANKWPVYRVPDGMLLVTSIGLVFLSKEQQTWGGNIGSKNRIELTGLQSRNNN
ncbi:serine hydrolase [Thalassotalea sp. PP2-459]|uniref:serine hydrolase domain-containing protein n=1 Tax=Thalassotalea sp. PP2-459 TaxID=1742724 RepID=UPI000942F660|nr:serine hydrolase domain-containing protein [Thalassotalea sp. PP2-459]OKY26987.1 hypothetical protein BI291_10735 [Thalassotalea sp. PP2-459]